MGVTNIVKLFGAGKYAIVNARFISIHTVDGQNPSPVDMVNIPLFTGFHTSQVVQDFLHQQYVSMSHR